MDSQEVSEQSQVEEMLAHLKPPIPVVDQDENSKVAEFYANRSVFITGATGFIGKALVEKLVRSCPRVKRIYILVREKRGKNIEERMSEYIKAPYFDRIRELYDGKDLHVLGEKLHAIRGDITQPKFGISPEDMRTLSDECSIVINSAATIRFVEPIDMAVKNNIYSVGQLVEFCNELAHLEALVHLSTAYSNCHKRDIINEIFYDPPMRGDQIQNAVDELRRIKTLMHVYPELPSCDDASNESANTLKASHRDACRSHRFYDDGLQFDASGELVKITERDTGKFNETVPAYDLLEEFTRIALRLSNRPNTYTFTKAVSESYLLDKTRARSDRYLDDKIPVAIVRPSIVGGAWREPTVGLVDNYNGPTGVILSLYTGALQAMPGAGAGKRVADIVPVDMVANMVLCTARFLVEQKLKPQREECLLTSDQSSASSRIKKDQGVYLFNFVSGFRNPMRWHLVTELIAVLAYKYPSKYLFRLPASYFVRAGRLYYWYDLINHKLPAYLMDLVKSMVHFKRVAGRKSALFGYTRIKQLTDTLTPFTSNQWKLSDDNTHALYESLDEADKQVFPFDVASIDWYEYIRAYIIGARIYTLRDEPKNVPQAMKKLQRRRAFYWITMGSLVLLCYCILLQNFF